MLVLKPESIAGLFPPNVPRGAGCLADRSFASGPPPVAINAAAPPTYRPALCTAEIPGKKGVGIGETLPAHGSARRPASSARHAGSPWRAGVHRSEAPPCPGTSHGTRTGRAGHR